MVYTNKTAGDSTEKQLWGVYKLVGLPTVCLNMEPTVSIFNKFSLKENKGITVVRP